MTPKEEFIGGGGIGAVIGARKLRDLEGGELRTGEGLGSGTEEASSMGETLPGDRIRRGSIREMRVVDLEL